MARKHPSLPETETDPELAAVRSPRGGTPRPSRPVSRDRRDRMQAPTVPPPRKGATKVDTRTSGVQSRRATKRSASGATVDEVVADLSKDPRRED